MAANKIRVSDDRHLMEPSVASVGLAPGCCFFVLRSWLPSGRRCGAAPAAIIGFSGGRARSEGGHPSSLLLNGCSCCRRESHLWSTSIERACSQIHGQQSSQSSARRSRIPVVGLWSATRRSGRVVAPIAMKNRTTNPLQSTVPFATPRRTRERVTRMAVPP